MKTSLFTLIACTVLGFNARAQDKARTTPVNPNGHLYAGMTEKDDAGCDGLETTFDMGNGNTGAMFNIVPSQSCKITFFDVLLNGASDSVSIYRYAGNFSGHEGIFEDWTLVGTVFMTLTTQDSLYRIPIYVNHELVPGDTVAYYITGHSNISVDYTDGTTENAVFSQDSYMKILEGVGIVYPFSDVFTPRILNMVVNYCPLFSFPCNELPTTYAMGNSNTGVIFDAVARQNLTISGYKAAVSGSGKTYLYTKPGSYLGAEQNPGLWTLRDSVQVTNAIETVPTELAFDPVTIATGDTMAFYLTFVPGSGSFHYTDGVEEGARVAYDGLLEIKAGLGMGELFTEGFTPRIFNGTLTYCMNNTTGINELTNAPGVKIYPNPFSSTATLEIENPEQYNALAVTLYDQAGRHVKQWDDLVSSTVAIDRKNLQSGLYLYVVSNAGMPLATGKLIIE